MRLFWFRRGISVTTPTEDHTTSTVTLKMPDNDRNKDVSLRTSVDAQGGIELFDQGGGGLYLSSPDGGTFIGGDTHGAFPLIATFGQQIAFFGGSFADQPDKPVTLQDVIDALVALGLVADS